MDIICRQVTASPPVEVHQFCFALLNNNYVTEFTEPCAVSPLVILHSQSCGGKPYK